MKITRIETIPLVFPYSEPLYDAQFKAGHRQTLIVRIHTDSGLIGIGESGSFGGPLETTKCVIDKELAPRLYGEDPLRTEWLWKKMYQMSLQHGRGGMIACAIGGIDIALWDIKAQAAGLPLYELLGGYRNKVKAYASGGFYTRSKDTAGIVREMKDYVEQGYRAVKMKVGRNRTPLNPLEVMPDPDFNYSVTEDLERVAAVVDAVGQEAEILVDANAAWDLHTALTFGRKLDQLGVTAFEEPINADDLEGNAILARKLDLKIIGYETEFSLYRFRELIQRRCVDIIQADLTWAGGITEGRRIAALAYAFNMEMMPHCFSSGITLMATLHFLGGTPNGAMLEMDRNPNGLRDGIVKDPLQIDTDGFVSLPRTPGLGIQLNDGTVEQYMVGNNG